MLHPKHARADHAIHDLIARRWSPRAFQAAQAVPRAVLLRLFEAARWAPSSRNEQPWRFLLVERDVAPDAWRALFETLTPKNRTWAAAAPILILVAVRLSYQATGSPNRMAWYDTGHAVALLTLQATAEGLGVRQMEGFDHEAARAAAGIPNEYEPAVIMAVGYTGSPETLSLEQHRAAERQPRERRSVAAFVYEGRWGQPIGPARE